MRLLNRTPPRFDDHLTFFTLAEASEFRRLVERSFAGVGRDVVVHPDHVEDRSGTTFRLWNIGALCAGVDRGDWAHVIDDHVRLVTTPGRGLADLSWDELESGLCLRLVQAATLPDPDSVAYARVVAPGLLEVLSVDLDDSIATPSRDELAPWSTLGALVERGRDNLRALLADDGLRVETVGEGGRRCFVEVTGDSFLTASLALVLTETVDRITGEDDWGRGVLVAVPSRHRLLYRPLDTADAANAPAHMARSALRGFAGEPGPLSPDVYWVRNRTWTQVTSCATGRPRVLRGTGLRDVLRVL